MTIKVGIVGMGAIGSLLAAWMAERLPPGTVRLAALARPGATADALCAHGLVLEQPEGERRIAIDVHTDAAAMGVQDLVILAVKGPALAGAVDGVAALTGPHTRVLTAMNGVPWWFFDGIDGPLHGASLDSVDPGGRARARIPAAQVLGAVVHLSSTCPAPGRVRHVNGNGLVLGAATGGLDGEAGRAVHEVAALLEGAGLAVTKSERIQREVWFKLWGNMTMNPVSAITGAPCDRILDDELVRGLCSAVMREAQAIGAAIGVPIEQAPEQRHAVTRKLGSFKTSMLQDVLAGRPLEIDALVGAVREIGQRLGQPTPFIDALLGLVRLMARERGLYPAAAPGVPVSS